MVPLVFHPTEFPVGAVYRQQAKVSTTFIDNRQEKSNLDYTPQRTDHISISCKQEKIRVMTYEKCSKYPII